MHRLASSLAFHIGSAQALPIAAVACNPAPLPRGTRLPGTRPTLDDIEVSSDLFGCDPKLLEARPGHWDKLLGHQSLQRGQGTVKPVDRGCQALARRPIEIFPGLGKSQSVFRRLR